MRKVYDMNELDKISQLLFGPGEVMPGIDMTWEQARAHFENTYPRTQTPYCIITDWIWIDLILSDQELELFKAAGQQPVILYSHSVLFDINRRFDVGDWVRTTPLVSFSDGCFFLTRNTCYVLVGDGLRKKAEFSTVMSLVP